jgi:hypothetical protein
LATPRNDVHLFSLSLHVALLHAHNRIVDLLRADGVSEADVFHRARATLTWHYQWIVAHDFLPRLVGPELVDQVQLEPRWTRRDSNRRRSTPPVPLSRLTISSPANRSARTVRPNVR